MANPVIASDMPDSRQAAPGPQASGKAQRNLSQERVAAAYVDVLEEIEAE